MSHTILRLVFLRFLSNFPSRRRNDFTRHQSGLLAWPSGLRNHTKSEHHTMSAPTELLHRWILNGSNPISSNSADVVAHDC